MVNHMAPRKGFRVLRVQHTHYLTPHMLRVVLGDDDLSDFPQGHESANFKLILPQPGQTDIADPPWTADTKPTIRTYTLRDFNAERHELSVDFVIYGDPGPGGRWALNAKIGDPVGFAGPGPPQIHDTQADWHLIGGDMSALPAASALLERLPKDAKGIAIFSVVSEEDIQTLNAPQGIDIRWHIHPKLHVHDEGFIDAIASVDWLPGSPAVWIAGEGGAMREIRRLMKKERDVDRQRLYVTAYWEIGMNEDRHQVVKRAELDD